MFSVFVFGILLGAIVFILISMNNELVITINSKYGISLGSNSDITKAYVAKRKKDKSGYKINHWNYYNDSGDKITDKALIRIIYNSFSHEDWYGEYVFYVNDKDFYQDTTSIEDVTKEDEIINSIDKMEDVVHRTPV